MQIVPMRDLKDTVKIETLCSETKGPVFVTKNGYGKLVVMDIECFEKLIRQAYEAKLVNEALDSYEKNETTDGNKVLEELKLKYGL
jgi:PHD/YefM family antitoxin component YafN of YafNO toxin-antitoxin module